MGESMNTTILRLLEDAVGTSDRSEFLRSMPKWSDDEADQFDDALKAQRAIDDKLWR